MASNSAYVSTEAEIDEPTSNHERRDDLSTNWKADMRAYSFDEAMELSGHGCYNVGLLFTLSLSYFATCMDMFSFSVVVAMCSCDFQLDIGQKRLLLSMPFLGAVGMAYAWGYFADTRGRRATLLVSMTGGFVMTVLCALSPNWGLMAACKLIGSCLSKN